MADRKSFLWPVTFLLVSVTVNLTWAKYVVRLRADSQCPMPGYFRDETDCRKFYRCAEHPTGVLGQNYITKAEFNCPQGTIYDEALSSCNHIVFVQNIPPGCDVGGTMTPGSSIGSGDSGNGVGSFGEATTFLPTTTTTPPPLAPPEHSQMKPILSGGETQQQQKPIYPVVTGPVIAGIVGDGDQEAKPFPPNLKPQIPQFPAVSFPPMVPLPSLPGDPEHQFISPALLQNNMNLQQNQQQANPNLPSVPGNPQLPQISFPPNFNLPGMSMVAGQLPQNSLNGQGVSQMEQNNLQNLASSFPGVTITTNPSQNGQGESNNIVGGSWVSPQQFPVVQPPTQDSGGWMVPTNFPTFYSTLVGSPFLLSTRTSNNPTSLILV